MNNIPAGYEDDFRTDIFFGGDLEDKDDEDYSCGSEVEEDSL